MNETNFYTTMPSSLGELLLVSNGETLTGLFMEIRTWAPSIDERFKRDDTLFKSAREQLEHYFAGALQTFDLPFKAKGTPFQERVWNTLTTIGYGETISYQELARRVGNPKAQRPVGSANGRNPIAIIIPCHRVIGADGSLTGYGGGLENKKTLLDLERRLTGARTASSCPLNGCPIHRALLSHQQSILRSRQMITSNTPMVRTCRHEGFRIPWHVA